MNNEIKQSWREDFYDEHTPVDKAIIDKHLRLSAEIDMWRDIRNFLIDELRRKKMKRRLDHESETNCGKCDACLFQPPSLDVYKAYRRLHFGRDEIGCGDVFPCLFGRFLQKTMLRELDVKHHCHGYMAVYQMKELAEDSRSFDEKEWTLNNVLEITKQDLKILARFRAGFLDFFDRVIKTVNAKKDRAKLTKERDWVAKHL
jgi:hypothetical protein